MRHADAATISQSTARGKTISTCRVWLDEPGLTNAVRIIRANDCKTTPWKNGGGSTTEIAIGPTGASLEAFDWRVSMARVAFDGPFSDSPASTAPRHRQGHGLVLTIGDQAPVTLSSGTDPVHFPAIRQRRRA